MKVYCFSYDGGYGGGCAIVVANSPAEAFGILVNTHPYAPDYTNLELCQELQDLKPKEDIEPQVIIFKFYSE